ncbi:MAG: hypothetical protein ACRDTR_02540, partial [Rubrobacter sp.]
MAAMGAIKGRVLKIWTSGDYTKIGNTTCGEDANAVALTTTPDHVPESVKGGAVTLMGTRTEGPAKGQKLALGLLLAALVAGCVLLVARPAYAVSTFTVNLTGDGSDMNLADDACDTLALLGRQCTLRAAIQQANATANAGGPDLIDFGFFGDGPYTISPASQLPIITQPLIIDGYTQSGASENTLDQPGRSDASIQIELDGTNAGLSATGLVFGIGVSDCVVRGLAINDFGEDGIVFISSTGHKVEGNFIGTDASGTSAQGND